MRLEELNLRPFPAKAGCRRSAYLEEEQAFIKPLPNGRYELATWNPNITVDTDYLVSDEKNKYSVSFHMIGERWISADKQYDRGIFPQKLRSISYEKDSCTTGTHRQYGLPDAGAQKVSELQQRRFHLMGKIHRNSKMTETEKLSSESKYGFTCGAE